MTKIQTAARALAASVLGLAVVAQAQTIHWNFGTNAVPLAAPVSNTAVNVSAGALTHGNNNGTTDLLTTNSVSTTYAGASGSYNAGAAARTGPLNTNDTGSAYFTFTLTPDATNTLRVTGLSFGSRSTSTGPQAFGIRSSLDGYAADLAAGTLANNQTWALKTTAFTAISQTPGTPLTVRIYGYDGAGSPVSGTANWRIDDLAVAVSAAGTNTPPVVLPITPRTARAGTALSLAVTVAPTDNDPVTATNVTAAMSVAGAFGLANGVFTYTPAAADLGEQTFTFTAQDKDGVSEPVAVVVTVRRAQTPAVALAAAAGAYVQDFNTLEASGTPEWDDAALPLPAWYACAGAVEVTQYQTGTGSSTSGGLYSYGVANAGDRSLGSLASGSSGTIRFGVAFTNTTGLAVTNLTIGFTAEQWRVGASAATNTLSFHYCITNRVLPLSAAAEWRPVAALDYDSPLTTDTQASGACHAAAARSAAITRYPILPGEALLLRWSDPDDTGNDHGLGIDDLTVAWAAGALLEAVPVGRAGAAENFDEMGRDAPATLVWPWRTEARGGAPRTNGPYASAGTRALLANTSAGFTPAGTYVFTGQALGDQAVGGLPGGEEAATVTVYGKFRNTAGMAIRRWRVGYATEKYRNGTASTAVQLRVSADGANWGAAGDPAAFAADGDTAGVAAGAGPLATARVDREAALAAAIPEGGLFYLAWQIAVTEGESVAGAQALGIDEVRIEPMFPSATVLLVR
ncbi:MAG: hypothetical protein FJ222_10680 [Lentisphaerae bacterium]|nr:hypothetical protein [Lentisphaerota bacterium]